jgi:subtilisin-like proprotein convertase family protein
MIFLRSFMNLSPMNSRKGRASLHPWVAFGVLLVLTASTAVAQPTFSGRVVTGPGSTGVPGVSVFCTLSPNNGGASGGSGFATTDANGNYSGAFSNGADGNGFEWRFTFTKAGHSIPGFDRRVNILSGNVALGETTVEYGPLTGQVLSGTHGLPGALVHPGGTPQYNLTTSVAIPNNSSLGVESTFNVNEPGFITGFTVRPVITHPMSGDLEIVLFHPDGTAVALRKSNGEGGPYSSPTYSVAAGNSYESLAILYGKSPTGRWRLRIRDLAPNNTGTFGGWNLTFVTGAVLRRRLHQPDNGEHAAPTTGVVRHPASLAAAARQCERCLVGDRRSQFRCL